MLSQYAAQSSNGTLKTIINHILTTCYSNSDDYIYDETFNVIPDDKIDSIFSAL
jgi:hypothetical protein